MSVLVSCDEEVRFMCVSGVGVAAATAIPMVSKPKTTVVSEAAVEEFVPEEEGVQTFLGEEEEGGRKGTAQEEKKARWVYGKKGIGGKGLTGSWNVTRLFITVMKMMMKWLLTLLLPGMKTYPVWKGRLPPPPKRRNVQSLCRKTRISPVMGRRYLMRIGSLLFCNVTRTFPVMMTKGGTRRDLKRVRQL